MSEGVWELFTATLIYSHRRVICAPLTNRVRDPYGKLRTEFSSRRFTAEARSARTIKKKKKQQKAKKNRIRNLHSGARKRGMIFRGQSGARERKLEKQLSL